MRSSSSKWLLGGGLVVLVLIIASLIVGLLNHSRSVPLLPEGTAGAAVQQYLLALETGESGRAYDFLSADLQKKCSAVYFRDVTRQFDRNDPNRASDSRIVLESEKPVDNAIEVQIQITDFYVSAPFDVNEITHTELFRLEKIDGNWRFVDEPWPVYGCPEPTPPR
jgi:hypothetical protein